MLCASMKAVIRFWLVVVPLLAFLDFAVGAELFPDAELATRPGAYSARTLGLGRTMLTGESGAPALLGNPSLLAAPGAELQIDVTGDVTRIKETRAYPIHDAFDGILAYNSYVLNDHLYSKLEGGVTYRIPQEVVPVLAVGLGSYSVYRFDYRYHEEVRYRDAVGGILDLPLAHNRLDISGDLRSISLGAAARGDLPLSVGFSVSLLTGDWAYEEGTFWVPEDSANQVTRIEYSPDGTPAEMIFGAAYEVSERLSAGFRALLPTGDFKFEELSRVQDGDSITVTNGSISVTYPARYALGLQYRPRSDFAPRIMLEGEFVAYSKSRDSWDDTFEIRAGVEQQVVRGVPVRAGFLFANAPDDDERTLAVFTTGIGFQHKNVFADFGMEFGKINYSHADLFPNTRFGGARVDVDHVETGLWRGMISVRYEL